MRQTMNQNVQRAYLVLLGAAATVAALGAVFASVLAGPSYAQTGAPTNTEAPSIRGSATVGTRLDADRGTWTGTNPITYTYRWLRCNAQGASCTEINDATDDRYTVQSADRASTLRVRVTARNDVGSNSANSNQTAVVQETAESVPASSVPRTERLIVSQVRFVPSRVTSRTAPIRAEVRIRDSRGLLIREAQVFMRATPRVTSGDTQATDAEGWARLTLTPNQNLRIRRGYNIQFFIKAFRTGDPALGGIAGYRLVQVRTATA